MEKYLTDTTDVRVAPHVDAAVIEAAIRTQDPLIIEVGKFTGKTAMNIMTEEGNT